MTKHGRSRTADKVAHARGLGDPGKRQQDRDDVRASIADAAARLISEGLTDYHAAKLKAARQLAVTDSKSLPDNLEIEAALRRRLALFKADSHPGQIEALRHTAMRAMRCLDRFSPWLVGAVLNGTANANSPIELELIAVEPKDFERFLLNERIRFETRQSPIRDRPACTMHYEIEVDRTPIQIALFDSHAQRQAAYPRDSVRHSRVQLHDAERLFVAD